MMYRYGKLDNCDRGGDYHSLYENQPKKNFKDALVFVFDVEGGYSDDPDDSGGATMFGITQKTFNKYLKSKGIDSYPVKEITRNIAEDVYYELYWVRGKCDKFPRDLAITHFDWCVNHGTAGAAKTLQYVAGVTVDGFIGPKTLDSVLNHSMNDLIVDYFDTRAEWYREFVRRVPSQKKFIKGWFNRIDKLAKFLDYDYKVDRS